MLRDADVGAEEYGTPDSGIEIMFGQGGEMWGIMAQIIRMCLL